VVNSSPGRRLRQRQPLLVYCLRVPHAPARGTLRPAVTRTTLLWLGLLLVVADAPLHAYIDPGSTSLFLQGLIGGVAALIVVTKSWWQRGLARLRGLGRLGRRSATREGGRSAVGREGGRRLEGTGSE
jgi:hypothetical protein